MIGIDEVGRGCWAGPLLVVAARQIKELPSGLADSKVLSKKQREMLLPHIIMSCELGEGWVEPYEIDEFGLTQAMYTAVERALHALEVTSREVIIIDGNINYCPQQFENAQCVIKADTIHPIVSAASIYAKVKRDAYMTEVATKHPYYQFEKHVGYGTKLHQEALKQYGTCEMHRLSYKPVRVYV